MELAGSSTEQLKIIANALCKIGKFFNEMTELCLNQLSQRGCMKDKHRSVLNRQGLKNSQNSKRLQKLKGTDVALDSKLEQIMNLKPKHPTSSFFQFYRFKGQEIAKENGETVGSRLARIVAMAWKNMSQTDKQPFQEKSRVSRIKYEEEMAEYRAKYADQIAMLKKYKRELKQSKKNKKQDLKQQCILKEKKDQDLHIIGEKQVLELQAQIQSQSQSILSMSQDMSDSFAEQLHSSSTSLSNTTQILCKQEQIASKDELAIKQEDISLLNIEELEEVFTQNHTTEQKMQNIKKENHHTVIQAEILPKTEIKEPQNKSNSLPKQKFNRPKGPVSSFLAFYQAEGKRLAQENHLSLGPATIKYASQVWKGMNASSKQKYQKISQQSRTKYRQQAEQIKKKYGEDALDKKKTKNIQKQKKKGKKQGLSADLM